MCDCRGCRRRRQHHTINSNGTNKRPEQTLNLSGFRELQRNCRNMIIKCLCNTLQVNLSRMDIIIINITQQNHRGLVALSSTQRRRLRRKDNQHKQHQPPSTHEPK